MGGAAFFAVDLEAESLYNYVDGGIFFFDHGIRDSFVFDCLGHDQLSVIAAITVQPDAVIGRIDNRIYTIITHKGRFVFRQSLFAYHRHQCQHEHQGQNDGQPLCGSVFQSILFHNIFLLRISVHFSIIPEGYFGTSRMKAHLGELVFVARGPKGKYNSNTDEFLRGVSV